MVSAVVLSPLVCLGLLLWMDSLEHSLLASTQRTPRPQPRQTAVTRVPERGTARAGSGQAVTGSATGRAA